MVCEKKLKYNELLKRLLKGIDFFESESVKQELKDDNIKRWCELKFRMNILLDEIGEMPEGGYLHEFK